MKHSIAILIPHFGPWPVWINFFIETCRANKDVDWILFSDAEPPENSARNVRHVRIPFADYTALASNALGVQIGAEIPYKLCDIRPALGSIHADIVRGYDFVGTGDLDVIYGDIRAFYDRELLERYDLLSSHADRVSGHFCLMRNRGDVIDAFRRVRGWKHAFRRTDYVNFDERALFNLFRGKKAKLLGQFGAGRMRCRFREAYSTPAVSSDMRWYWESGRLINEHYPHHPFMYLHFMSWHSNRWYGSQAHVLAGAEAPWSRLSSVVQMDWRDARERGFMIGPQGIQPIDRRPYP